MQRKHLNYCAALALSALTAFPALSKDAGSSIAYRPTSPQMALITESQYNNAIKYTFGEDVVPHVHFPPMRRDNGLVALGAESAEVTSGAFALYYESARAIADKATDAVHRATVVGCIPRSPDAPDEPCTSKFFSRIGPLLYRRPLTKVEIDDLVQSAGRSAATLKDFHAGLASTLAGMLVSPNFLFYTDVTDRSTSHSGTVQLDAYSKAARLSKFLWNGFPDPALLRAAGKGELNTAKGFERQVDRMLQSPRFADGVRAFFDDMLTWEDIDTLNKDPTVYGFFSVAVAEVAKEQTLRTIVDHVVTHDQDYRTLFTSPRTAITGSLGPIYKAAVAQPDEWTSVDNPDGERAGLLTQPSFLALYAHPARSSATRRGRALREVFLCQKVPDPPPNVNFAIVDDPNRKFHTARQRVAAHLENPVCAGCHRITDPIGLGLENFDGAGRYRATEGGAPIDGSGVLDGRKFTNVKELGEAVRDHPQLPACLVKRMYAYAYGQSLKDENQTFYESLLATFQKDGYRLRPLMRTVALNPAFITASSTQ